MLKKIITTAGSYLATAGHKLENTFSEQHKRVKPWLLAQGDQTLRLDYDLNANSVVFDLGGYQGQWSSDIYSKYNANIYIFEPYQAFFENIQRRFEQNRKIQIFPFGLSLANRTVDLNVSDDGSSMFRKGEKTVEITLVKAEDFLKKNNLLRIDLMKLNIEGGEYDLLEHFIETGRIKTINNIQVQFHTFVENADERMRKIQTEISKTHQLTYQYEFVWENWKRKS